MLYYITLQVYDGKDEIANAINYPLLRLFTAALKSSKTPQAELLEVEQGWSVASPSKSRKNISYIHIFNFLSALITPHLFKERFLVIISQPNIYFEEYSIFGEFMFSKYYCSTESVGGKDWTYFSATCWFYGQNLFKSLQYPIGTQILLLLLRESSTLLAMLSTTITTL